MSEKEMIGSGPLVRLRLLPSRALFRAGPAWAVLAGAIAAGVTGYGVETVLTLLAAAGLADLIWGSVRQVVPDPREARAAGQPHSTTVSLAVPYLQPDAPLSGWLRNLTPGGTQEGRGWQGVVLAAAAALVLSLLLGIPALVLTAAAFLVIALATAVARRGDAPAVWNALLDVGLPWALGASLVLWGSENAVQAAVPAACLAFAFTVLQWGVYRSQAAAGMRLPQALLWLGQLLVLLVLVGFRQPWAVAVVAALMAPPSFWLGHATSAGLARSLPWWWAAMLVAALSMNQSVML